MMAPEYYQRARRAAPIHAQIRIANVVIRHDSLLVSGRYVRVFTGLFRGAVPGRLVRLTLPLVSSDADVLPILGGGCLYSREYFDGVRWLEVYLECDDRGVEPVDGAVVRLDRPSFFPII